MQIIDPNHYLTALSKTELKVLRGALKAWKGPYGKNPRTPTEIEYQQELLEVRDKMLEQLKGCLRR